MKIQLATKPLSEVKNDYFVLPIYENSDSNQYKFDIVSGFLAENPKFGKAGESQLIYSKDQKILLLGAGKKEKFSFIDFQNWAGSAVKQLASKAKQISLLLPKVSNLSADQIGEAMAIGIEIAAFDPIKDYKSEPEPLKLNSVEIVVERAEKGYQDGIKKGQIIASGINLVRNLGDMPPNEMTPTFFLNMARKIARENKLKITVLDEKQAKKKGMGAFIGVAQGSQEPSFIIALEYNGNIRSKDKLGLVGKGITFDTGGISIKPSSSMHEMKYDMVGAAAVLATLMIISKLDLKTNIVGVMAVTENFPGPNAQRPGDVVRTYSGKTAEVLDTDAEGRLVLVDAVAYALKDFKATKLIDIATLTGAIIVALGDHITGVMGNNPQFTQELIATAAKVGEKMWELPLDEEFTPMIKSDIADIANIGRGGSHRGAGGSITGAKFIQAAVDDKYPWVHLDIAGTGWDMKPKPFRTIGATGVGVKTLVELISKS